ncbi:hypothetical protein ACFYNL_39305 [Streptomyces sp. NPDC007808]|uniref:hypothetical protein n=1 Tax=Streptomyces sp. NPDC007808 TaxID=3364779 RepID=UPI0036A9311C
MSAVPVTIQRGRPPVVRPTARSLVATQEVAVVTDLDTLLEGNDCSCSSSDDNPH